MRPAGNPPPIDPNDIDPEEEDRRTKRLKELRDSYDAAMLQREVAGRRQRDIEAALPQLQTELQQSAQQMLSAQLDAHATRATAER